jgi:energy-coupling factor transporter ATP-binding protein EcfA2
MSDVTTDILEWAAKLKPWQQDALRRLATASQLTSADEDEVLAVVKAEHGIALEPPPPPTEPLTLAHLSVGSGGDVVRLKAITQVRNANRLADDQRLEFSTVGLTVVYGPNGSGKSGYTRVLANACRSRVSSVDGRRRAILADVYGTAAGPAAASLHLDVAGSDEVIPWTDGQPPHRILGKIAVFDSDAAAVYVDEGSHIAFLPFNLDLLFRLNNVCIQLRGKLETEIKGLKDVLANVKNDFSATTEAGRFLATLSAQTSEDTIKAATTWSEEHASRLQELTNFLSDQDQRELPHLHSFAGWAEQFAQRIADTSKALSEDSIHALQACQAEAIAARTAANAASEAAFNADCLPGVGTETWRRLYAAAREFSLQAAYPGRAFPVVDDGARCVLCHQDLASQAAERVRRFEDFVTGELARQVVSAEEAVQNATEAVAACIVSEDSEDARYMPILEQHDATLAARLSVWIAEATAKKSSILAACEDARRWETSTSWSDADMSGAVAQFAQALRASIVARDAARQGDERLRLEAERRDLEARQRLSPLRSVVEQRVKDLELHAALSACVEATSTAGITRKAGELSEKHLTPRVRALFDSEVSALRLKHLNASLARRPDRRGAQYTADLAPAVKCHTSDILSEGEHRALALASFLAEARSVSDEATLVVDDPVSSLDHDRSILVARRLVQEAERRQIIIFTHSLVFLHHLVVEAERQSVDLECKGVYRQGTRAGMLDPAGEPWEGKSLKRRIGIMDAMLAQVRAAESGPPAEYGMCVRQFYGRLRDCWERLVEEKVFAGVMMRFDQGIKTQNLRYVELSDDVHRRIEAGMDRTSTYSHDNPASLTDPIPMASEVAADLQELRDVVALVDARNKATEARRNSPIFGALTTPTTASTP